MCGNKYLKYKKLPNQPQSPGPLAEPPSAEKNFCDLVCSNGGMVEGLDCLTEN